MKRALFAFFLLGMAAALLAQNSLTKIAVVDLDRVLSVLSDPQADGGEFTAKRDAIQAELNRRGAELLELKARLAETTETGLKSETRTLEREIKERETALRAYLVESREELEREGAKLSVSDAILTRLHAVLREVAESEGYTMVMDKKIGRGVLYSRNSVDITGKVLEKLQGRGKR
ncbi:MAG: OmpH family outer membrane protein [Treponema sp.]|jgi:Skp family chaperone for outer membrane proteins|nr:OmpH family outer membrane protein [Treponema sp.]